MAIEDRTVNLSRLRVVLGITLLLACLSIGDLFKLAEKLGVAPFSSKTWLGALCLLALISGLSLVFIVHVPLRMQGFSKFPIARRFIAVVRWVGISMLPGTLALYSLIAFQPVYRELLAGQVWLRLFLFWLCILLAMLVFMLAFPGTRWDSAFLVAVLLQAVVYRVAMYFPDITAYPFTLGWSETSRYYSPSLFVSRIVFPTGVWAGQSLSWPIVSPSLHLLLAPPYLWDAPLWFHRFWQVALRFALVGLIAPALLYRLKIKAKAGSQFFYGLAATWIFLYLFTLALYLHLALPVFMMLWGFSVKDQRRTWIWLVLASIWAGISRVNWYPVPGILAAVLYFLEVPQNNPDNTAINRDSARFSRADSAGSSRTRVSWAQTWRYLIKPFWWVLAGTAVAFASMQVYIFLSGVPNQGDFYTSLMSAKLWYRLLPNETYRLGVLPAIVIFSLPLWLGLFFMGRKRWSEWGFQRVCWLTMILVGLFVGGLLVSAKIGGGADIHNMDAYAVVLLIIFAYLFREEFFGPPGFESGIPYPVRAGNWFSGDSARSSTQSGCSIRADGIGLRSRKWAWAFIGLLVLVPAWFAASSLTAFWQYDAAKAELTLQALQHEVDRVNAAGGEILFINQRHLISMHMLKNVKLVPEYEIEDLGEMAISQNQVYLQRFRTDLEMHRFAAIVVIPLRFNLVGDQDAMGAENNAWARFAAKRILCNYTQEAIFPDDRVAIYVPQAGGQNCP